MSVEKQILKRNNYGVFFNKSLLQHIKDKNNSRVLAILQRADPVKLSSSLGTTLLHSAAEHGNAWLTRHLLGLGIPVDVQNRLLETPLMFAVAARQRETTILLLESRADLLLSNSNDQCALAVALRGPEVDLKVWSLLSSKLTVDALKNSRHANTGSFHEHCPLYRFVGLKNPAITRILLDRGSPVNAREPRSGHTALHEAVKLTDHRQVKLLLKFGADANALTTYGKTPLTLCCESRITGGMLEIAKSLLKAGGVVDFDSEDLMTRVIMSYGDGEIVRLLLKSKLLDLHSVDRWGMKPLHHLASNVNPGILRECEGLDFDFNSERSVGNGYTMLHYAADIGNPSSIEYLLDRGADVDAKDGGMKTPLYRLYEPLIARPIESRWCPTKLSNTLKSIDVLLERGADFQIFKRGLRENQPFGDEVVCVLSPVIARMALMEATGRSVDANVRREIDGCARLKGVFQAMGTQLEELRRCEVDRGLSLSWFDFLTAGDERILRWAGDRRLAASLESAMGKCKPDTYYRCMLRRRYGKFRRLVEVRNRVMMVIGKIAVKCYNIRIDDVTDLIVDYLSERDMVTVSTISI